MTSEYFKRYQGTNVFGDELMRTTTGNNKACIHTSKYIIRKMIPATVVRTHVGVSCSRRRGSAVVQQPTYNSTYVQKGT